MTATHSIKAGAFGSTRHPNTAGRILRNLWKHRHNGGLDLSRLGCGTSARPKQLAELLNQLKGAGFITEKPEGTFELTRLGTQIASCLWPGASWPEPQPNRRFALGVENVVLGETVLGTIRS